MSRNKQPDALSGGRLMTAAEVAEHLRVSTRTVRRLVRDRELPRVVVGRRAVRFDPRDVRRLTRPDG